MSDIPTLQVPTIPIAHSPALFPVRRIFCVGQNYADYAREMGAEPNRQAPFFFTKPADAVVASGLRLPFPPKTVNLHHEVELVIALGRSGVDVKPQDAPSMIFGYAVGIDLTRRDLQAEAKKRAGHGTCRRASTIPRLSVHCTEDFRRAAARLSCLLTVTFGIAGIDPIEVTFE
jgi:2-keto-4-pentenoate hydratase/2-oxohepta-3-ene-1,7-dioic acid hydratase in catechol pathway